MTRNKFVYLANLTFGLELFMFPSIKSFQKKVLSFETYLLCVW